MRRVHPDLLGPLMELAEAIGFVHALNMGQAVRDVKGQAVRTSDADASSARLNASQIG